MVIIKIVKRNIKKQKKVVLLGSTKEKLKKVILTICENQYKSCPKNNAFVALHIREDYYKYITHYFSGLF